MTSDTLCPETLDLPRSHFRSTNWLTRQLITPVDRFDACAPGGTTAILKSRLFVRTETPARSDRHWDFAQVNAAGAGSTTGLRLTVANPAVALRWRDRDPTSSTNLLVQQALLKHGP